MWYSFNIHIYVATVIIVVVHKCHNQTKLFPCLTSCTIFSGIQKEDHRKETIRLNLDQIKWVFFSVLHFSPLGDFMVLTGIIIINSGINLFKIHVYNPVCVYGYVWVLYVCMYVYIYTYMYFMWL